MRRFISDVFYSVFPDGVKRDTKRAEDLAVTATVLIALASWVEPDYKGEPSARRQAAIAGWIVLAAQVLILCVVFLIRGDDDGNGGRKKPLPDPTPSNDEPLRIPKEWLTVSAK